jgi:hypothetical protein
MMPVMPATSAEKGATGRRASQALQVGLGVGAHGEEGGVAERNLPGEADQQHQAEADDGVDADEGELRHPVFGQQPGCGDQRQQRAPRTRSLAAVLEQMSCVTGLEYEMLAA